MSVREAHPQPPAFRATPVAAGHIGGGPDLVNADEALGIEVNLAVEPAPTLPQDVRTVLFDRVPVLLRVVP